MLLFCFADHPRYTKLRDLNSGGFGFVQLCRDAAYGRQVPSRPSHAAGPLSQLCMTKARSRLHAVRTLLLSLHCLMLEGRICSSGAGSGRPAGSRCPANRVWCRLLQVAIKFVERGAGITKNVVREILNHRLCSLHPHIIQVPRLHPSAATEYLPWASSSAAHSKPAI